MTRMKTARVCKGAGAARGAHTAAGSSSATPVEHVLAGPRAALSAKLASSSTVTHAERDMTRNNAKRGRALTLTITNTRILVLVYIGWGRRVRIAPQETLVVAAMAQLVVALVS